MTKKAKLEFEGKVQSWGNSLGLRINRTISELTGLRKGTLVSIGVTEDAVVVRRKPPESYAGRRYTEAELLKGMTPHTAHADEVPELLAGEAEN